MKIAVITSSFPRFQGDGAGSFIYSLTRSLTRLDHEVMVFAPDDPEVVARWQADVTVKRVRFVLPRSWSRLGHAHSLSADVRMKWHAYPLVILFSLFAVLELLREVRRHGSDVIYAQWLIPGGFIGAVVSELTHVPLVVAVHGSDVFVAEHANILRPAVSSILGTARHIVACSGDLARRVAMLGFPEDRITVVPYGVDVDRYKPDPTARRLLRETLAIASEQRVVMSMGRLVHKKGFGYLVQAMPQVLARCPNTTFIVAGEGELRAQLQAMAQEAGVLQHVLFPGHVPWHLTPQYLAVADVLVIPSVLDDAGNIDGLPNVLLESMATACAIVATEVAGIPEVVRHGDNGLLVPQKDVSTLAAAICRLLEDSALRQRLGTQARLTTTSSHGWTQIAERIITILEASSREVS
jgi:glycosyltransferase involved in cell wall biosynthesis